MIWVTVGMVLFSAAFAFYGVRQASKAERQEAAVRADLEEARANWRWCRRALGDTKTLLLEWHDASVAASRQDGLVEITTPFDSLKEFDALMEKTCTVFGCDWTQKEYIMKKADKL